MYKYLIWFKIRVLIIFKYEINKVLKKFIHLLEFHFCKFFLKNSLRHNERNPQDKTTQEQQKTAQARDEAEEAELKADQARDALASEMFALLSKEVQFSNSVLQYLKLQRAYHESALHILTDVIPHMEKHISKNNFVLSAYMFYLC